MNPTLSEPEMIEIVPYGNGPPRVGDVVFFLPPRKDHPVVHRVARVTPAGISTRGDNNTQDDVFLLQPKDIRGQVMAAWRGDKRREIAGGWQGRLTRRWLRWRRIPGKGVSHLLHPLYDALSRCGLVARLLPAPMRPRVVVYQAHGQDQVRLLLGRHSIGRYDDQKRRWQIERPFRLFVDERALPRLKDESHSGSFCSSEHRGP
jgi:hypothetical protein